MKNLPENELFSAYVDGELTADEQAQVDELLAASPAARQLVDELRALSSSLQALPMHKIGEDITARVLRRAEREMLSERAPVDSPPPAVTPPESFGWKATLRRMARPRNLVWPGAAVAVALLLMLTDLTPFRETPDQAVATRSPAEADDSGPSPSISVADEVEAEMVVDEAVALEEESRGRLPSDRADFAMGKADAPDPTSTAASEAPAPAAPPSAALAESAPASEPAKAPAMGRGGQAGYGYDPGEGGARRSGADLAASPEMPGVQEKLRGMGEESARGQAEPDDRPSVAAEMAKPARAAAPMPPGAPAAGQPLPNVQRSDPSLLVLSYRVTADAVRQRVFDKLVRDQAIAQIIPAAKGVDKRARADAMASNAARQDSGFFEETDVASDVIHVDVEATRDQISALLGDLNDRADQFSFLAYDDSSPGVESLDEATPRVPGQMAAGKLSAGQVQRARQPMAEGDDVWRKGSGVDLDALLLRRGFREGGGQALRRAEAGEAAEDMEKPASPSLQQRGGREAVQEKEEAEEPARGAVAEADPAKSEEANEKQRSSAKAKDEERSAPPARALKRQLGVPTFRVRFVLRVVNVDKFSVAASLANEAPGAEEAAENALQMTEPVEPTAASPAQPAERNP